VLCERGFETNDGRAVLWSRVCRFLLSGECLVPALCVCRHLVFDVGGVADNRYCVCVDNENSYNEEFPSLDGSGAVPRANFTLIGSGKREDARGSSESAPLGARVAAQHRLRR
jgi:hypothetical protein